MVSEFSVLLREVEIKQFPLNMGFYSTERRLERAHVKKIRNRKNTYPYPIIVKFGTQYFIRDGHHRIYSALCRGQKTIKVRYYEI
jgi:hypothetical protein